MSDTLDDIPDEVRALIEGENEAPLEMLYAIGVEIASKRDDAKAARQTSGIEETWMEAEEAYLGVDDANRHEFNGMRWAKPMAIDAPLTTGQTKKENDNRSTLFVRLTSRYVDAGSAKLGEILLPADDKAFEFDAMPVPELIEAKEDESQVVHSAMGVPLTRPVAPGETPPAAPAAPPVTPAATPAMMPAVGAAQAGATGYPGGQTLTAHPPGPGAPSASPQAPARTALTVKDLAVENIELATKKAKAAETRIYDWMIQGGYRGEFRKMIADAARIGTGVLKGPTPKLKRVAAFHKTDNGGTVVIKETIVPAIEWKDPWNIFPDPACGENIHDGGFIFERDYFSARQVKALKKLPGYIAAQIDKVLEEGPNKSYQTSGADRRADSQRHKDRFEIWYFTGTLDREEMDAICLAANSDKTNGGSDQVSVIVTLINDSVVRATPNPLDSGEFNYHSLPWQRRGGHWAGVGVAEQMRTPQRVTNAALRAMLNNAAKSADNQYFIDTTSIRPMDGKWEITPGKIWGPTKDGPADIRQSFLAVQIPNTTAQMMTIIELGERMAEETTSIPLITQGQSGATTPDTFGAAQLQNNNANQLLRSIGYSTDDFITEPMVRQFYEWLLLDPDVPDEEKGEFQIDAHGSAALVERAIQEQTVAQLLGASKDPAYGLDPKKTMSVYLKSKRLKPADMQYTPEEQEKMEAAPPPEQPAVTVAKINQDTQLKIAVMGQTADQQTAQAEGQIAAAAHALEAGRVQVDQTQIHGELTLKAHQLQMDQERARAENESKLKIALDDAKVQLAKVTMQLQAEQSLNAQNQRHEMRKHVTPQPKPPVQVPGRAANGAAFSQNAPQ